MTEAVTIDDQMTSEYEHEIVKNIEKLAKESALFKISYGVSRVIQIISASNRSLSWQLKSLKPNVFGCPLV